MRRTPNKSTFTISIQRAKRVRKRVILHTTAKWEWYKNLIKVYKANTLTRPMKTPKSDSMDGSEPTLMIPPALANKQLFDGSSTTIMYVPENNEQPCDGSEKTAILPATPIPPASPFDGSETTLQHPFQPQPLLDPFEDVGSCRYQLGNRVLNPLLFIREYISLPKDGKGFVIILEDAVNLIKRIKHNGKEITIAFDYDVPLCRKERPIHNENVYSMPLYKSNEQDKEGLTRLVFAEFSKTGHRRHGIYNPDTCDFYLIDVNLFRNEHEKKTGMSRAHLRFGTYHETNTATICAQGRKGEKLIARIEKLAREQV